MQNEYQKTDILIAMISSIVCLMVWFYLWNMSWERQWEQNLMQYQIKNRHNIDCSLYTTWFAEYLFDKQD